MTKKAKLQVHTDDLPAWAYRKQKLPETYLGFLKEEAFPSPDGKGMISMEDRMLRQQWDAMLTGDTKARDWLLNKVMKENEAVLAAAPERPTVTLDAIHQFQPLGPVLEILGAANVHSPDDGSKTPSSISLAPWFLQELHKRCRPDKLAPVLSWQAKGGQQTPRINRDWL